MANLRTLDYMGFKAASSSLGTSGWMFWSGSKVLTGSGAANGLDTTYDGIGLEAALHSESFFRYSASSAGSGLEIRTDTFFLGSSAQFISGSGGNIGISSSNFELTSDGNVTMQGTITATAGDIGGFTITDKAIASSDLALVLSGSGVITASSGKIGGFVLSATSISSSGLLLKSSGQITGSKVQFTGGDIGGFALTSTQISSSGLLLKSSGQITGSKVLFTGGKIAGWTIDEEKLSNTGVHVSASYGIKAFDATAANNDFVELKYKANDNFGIIGKSAGNTIFSLGKNLISGVANNQIAGWEFDNEKLTGGAMIIRKDGTIESDGFASNLAGSGFRLTAASGGFLEVENARIRGTLSTAVFEKEAVNAVGGQLYVANSTTLTGSTFPTTLEPSGYTSSEYPANETTMSVVNVTGFAVGEILTAKKITDTGFATEYMKVESSSRFAGSSDNDFTGAIYVERGLGQSFAGASGSLGDGGGSAQAYSGSQVIVSTGKRGTGYIRLNANPNDPTTPYIDIVERTGSDVYDVDLKARLGDLSGVTDSKFSDGVTGFGLYTQNGYFSGKIEVASLPGLPTKDPTYHYDFNTGNGSVVYNTVGTDLNHISGTIVNPNDCWVSGSGNFITGGKALKFESGKNTRIEIEDREWYYPGGSTTPINSASLSVWIKPENVAHTEPQIVWEAGGASNGKCLYVSSSHVWFTVWEGSSNNYDALKVSASIESNVWTHVAATTYHGTASIYLNGTHKKTETGHPDINTNGVNYSGFTGIGASHNDSAIITSSFTQTSGAVSGDGKNPFTGSIDELRVYGHHKLTANNITALYQSPAGTVGGSTVIEGNRIKTGRILSTNYGASVGSEIDLDNGTIKLGGSSAPDFAVDESGAVTASAGKIASWTINASTLTGGSTTLNSNGTITCADLQASTGGNIAGWTISSTKLSKNGTSNANYMALDAGNQKLQIGGNSKTRVELSGGSLQYFSGSNNTAFLQTVTSPSTIEVITKQIKWMSMNNTPDNLDTNRKFAGLIISASNPSYNFFGQMTASYYNTMGMPFTNTGDTFSPTEWHGPGTLQGTFASNGWTQTPEFVEYGINLKTPGSFSTLYAYQHKSENRVQLPTGTWYGPSQGPQPSPGGNFGGNSLGGIPSTDHTKVLVGGREQEYFSHRFATSGSHSLQGAFWNTANANISNVLSEIDFTYNNTYSAPQVYGFHCQISSTSTTAANRYCFYGDGGHIYTTGDVRAGGDVVAFQTSDKRLKYDINTIDSALTKLDKINGVSFRWKKLNDERAQKISRNHLITKGLDYGVIAQEIEKVLPEVVRTGDHGYKSVRYEKIIPLLIESIKELNEEVKTLKKKLGDKDAG